MIASRLLSFFPPPELLTFPRIGLDVSDQAIRFVELQLAGRHYTLKRSGSVVLAKGVVQDGTIVNQSEFARAVRELGKGVEIAFANISVPEKKAYLFQVRMEERPLAELRRLVEFRLEENVPLSASEAIFDFELTPVSARSNLVDASVTVLPKEFTEDYASALREARLTPLSFDVEANAIARAVVPKDTTDTLLVVDFGQYKTVLSIVSGGVVQFTSTLSIGGDLLTGALSRHLKLSREKAEEIKWATGLIEHKGDLELWSSLVNPLSALKDEINRVLLYWNTHDVAEGERRPTIRTIIFSGMDSAIKGFDKYMSASLKVDVHIGNVWTNVAPFDDYIPDMPRQKSLSFATAIGLALR